MDTRRPSACSRLVLVVVAARDARAALRWRAGRRGLLPPQEAVDHAHAAAVARLPWTSTSHGSALIPCAGHIGGTAARGGCIDFMIERRRAGGAPLTIQQNARNLDFRTDPAATDADPAARRRPLSPSSLTSKSVAGAHTIPLTPAEVRRRLKGRRPASAAAADQYDEGDRTMSRYRRSTLPSAGLCGGRRSAAALQASSRDGSDIACGGRHCRDGDGRRTGAGVKLAGTAVASGEAASSARGWSVATRRAS